MFINPHVHCRDEEQSPKETIEHALRVAERAGFTAIFDMPNTARPVTTQERVLERLALAQRANSPVQYGIYMALTANPEQVKRAVQTFRKHSEVVGFKLYAGHSVGNIGVITEEDQGRIYETLSHEGYDRVIVVHCEKESLIRKKPDGSQDWNPTDPITHAYARPPEAEVESVKDQIRIAKQARYRGILHIAHVSVPESVHIAYAETELNVTCGVTPHHLLLDYTAMASHYGLILKMNPPLRPRGMNTELLELLRQGKINWIETDHAPHTLEEKVGTPYMSGITNLQKYPKFIRWLKRQGFDDNKIQAITYQNIVDTFGLKIEPRTCTPEYDLEGEYPFDPYQGLGVLD
ncbi:MAG TPA: dihydroorotase [Candidatus Nanoarchaeia archaeon]|nr:dihydroorotase [Candidatus Nanoarchaeia archaeon]